MADTIGQRRDDAGRAMDDDTIVATDVIVLTRAPDDPDLTTAQRWRRKTPRGHAGSLGQPDVDVDLVGETQHGCETLT
jgi:hypothetical protein